MNDPKDFPYPLDTDIIEQVPVQKVSVDEIDEKTGSAKFSVKTIMQQRTTRYINAPLVKARCKPGEHVFRVYNAKKWLFACTLCPFVRKVFPTTYRFDESTGKLIHVITGRAV